MNPKKLTSLIDRLYGSDEETLNYQQERFSRLEKQFKHVFKGEPQFWFSTPGRTELGGNHTDHNNGRVLAAAIRLDAIAAASPCREPRISLYSNLSDQPNVVELDEKKVHMDEFGTVTALIRGINERLDHLGYNTGGFNAIIQSDVRIGSGLSSSAVIEVLIGSMFNFLFNGGKIAVETIAGIGQFAENVFFGKPCGLMDQMTCSIGGVVAIDFEYPEIPLIERVDVDFDAFDHDLLVVYTGRSPVDLTREYAMIPEDMQNVAAEFSFEHLRQVGEEDVLMQINDLRRQCGDRAVLRALHFFRENERVGEQIFSLETRRFSRFLELVRESGDSSYRWLQNIYAPDHPRHQALATALALSEDFFTAIGSGICRVHGGGFKGTIQAWVPHEFAAQYQQMMENVFGQGCVRKLTIRRRGTLCLNKYLL